MLRKPPLPVTHVKNTFLRLPCKLILKLEGEKMLLPHLGPIAPKFYLSVLKMYV